MGFEDIGALHLGQNRELCCVWVGVVAWPNGHPLLLHHNFFGPPHKKKKRISGYERIGGGGGCSTKKYMPRPKKLGDQLFDGPVKLENYCITSNISTQK
jgi:hypothetical protein